MKKYISGILFVLCVGTGCAFFLLGNRNIMTQEKKEKSVLLIDGGSRVECREIILEDCRDESIDHCKEKGTLLYVNNKNQIVERKIAGEEQVIDIEAIDQAGTVSNVQYDPFGEGLYFIYENQIYHYSLDDKTITKKTDGIDSTWRRTYIWANDEYGYKLADNGKFSELYRMDGNETPEQKVCEGWIESIGQVKENKLYALQVYSNAAHDSSTADLRNRIIEIDTSDGTIKIIQEMGSWMEGNYLFVCNGDDIFYMQKKGNKECLYRVNLNTGSKEKVFHTGNQVIGLAVN